MGSFFLNVIVAVTILLHVVILETFTGLAAFDDAKEGNNVVCNYRDLMDSSRAPPTHYPPTHYIQYSHWSVYNNYIFNNLIRFV